MYTMNSRLDTENIKFLKQKRNSRIFPEIKVESLEIKMRKREREEEKVSNAEHNQGSHLCRVDFQRRSAVDEPRAIIKKEENYPEHWSLQMRRACRVLMSEDSLQIFYAQR